MYISGSTFIRKIEPLLVIILLCLGNTSRKQDCKATTSLLVLLVQSFNTVMDELGPIHQ